MTAPLDEKGLEAAIRAIKSQRCTCAYEDLASTAIRAYLAALPGEAEVVGLVERLRKGTIEYQSPSGPIYAGPDALHREAADALQAMQARAEAAERERDAALALVNYIEDVSKVVVASAEAAETRIKALEEALKPFGEYLDHMPVDVDNNGAPGPDSEGVGWVYLTCGDFRRARTTLQKEQADG